MNYWLSLLIASLLGFLGVNILRARNSVDPMLHVIASIGLGMALSAHIIFYSLFTVGQYNAVLIWIIHTVVFFVLVIANVKAFKKSSQSIWPNMGGNKSAWLGVGILALLLIPLWREANFYPLGGWDAWACWNLKAKFIFLGGLDWKNMLDPIMWRSNNQYPFLLPLMNVWGWSFYGNPAPTVPLSNTILFTLLTAILMCFSIHRSSGKILSVIPPLVLFTIPFVNTLSISQYSDILVAFYLLGSFVCIVAAREEKNSGLAVLSGLCCGLMSFTKTEGTLASVLIIGLAVLYLGKDIKHRDLLWPFLIATAVSALPTVLFQLFWAPENASFINGLASIDHPSNLLRLKIIGMFLCAELISPKWNGLWIILACGLLLSWSRGFKNGRWIVPIFLTLYLGGVLGYYLINTHYEIIWWLQMTLNRVLYIILPTVIWWIFYTLSNDTNLNQKIKNG